MNPTAEWTAQQVIEACPWNTVPNYLLRDRDKIYGGFFQKRYRSHGSYKGREGTNAPTRIYWFSDRIEILSPGGPFGQVNRDNLGNPGVTDYRNPHLAEAMKNLGYVQRFGIGIQLARKELEKNGNPPPEFSIEDTHILVILRRRP